MDGKAKSICCLGMVKINKLSHSYLNGMKLENYFDVGVTFEMIRTG